MNIKKHIPNFLTCCNLLCGCIGIIAVSYGNLIAASYCIYLACVFDFFDGFAARALKVSSPIGKDLDSLADMVTFGVLPGIMMIGLYTNGNMGMEMLFTDLDPRLPLPDGVDMNWSMKIMGIMALLPLLIPLFSAIRLAKFNNDSRQSDRFIGLPTPANALFISALPFISNWLLTKDFEGSTFIGFLYMYDWGLVILPFVLSYLLVAELPLIALKFKNYGWPDNKMRYILIISALILLLTLNFIAIPIIIILYIILSIIENTFVKEKAIQ